MEDSNHATRLVDRVLVDVEAIEVSDLMEREYELSMEKYTTTTAPSSPDPIDYKPSGEFYFN